MTGVSDATWRPVATPAVLAARAQLLTRLRDFFQQAGVMEVETPTCSHFAPLDPALDSFTTRFIGPGYPDGVTLYLQTSPEFAMKRLLAAGSGPIYQVCRAYRNGEWGARHHPEFSLLEWYRPGFDHHRLMDEVAALVNRLAAQTLPQQRLSYAELFQSRLGFNPHRVEAQTLRDCALSQGVDISRLDLVHRDGWLDLLLTHCIEPQFPAGMLTFIYDYPASQAALARVRPGTPPLAERFELYWGDLELANGFHELADAAEQARRFQLEQAHRQARGQPPLPQDKHLIAALAAGLPDCAGVALGLDRLLMRLIDTPQLQSVLAFSLDRA